MVANHRRVRIVGTAYVWVEYAFNSVYATIADAHTPFQRVIMLVLISLYNR